MTYTGKELLDQLRALQPTVPQLYSETGAVAIILEQISFKSPKTLGVVARLGYNRIGQVKVFTNCPSGFTPQTLREMADWAEKLGVE